MEQKELRCKRGRFNGGEADQAWSKPGPVRSGEEQMTRDLAVLGALLLIGFGGLRMNRRHQIDIVARTIWGEARGEGVEGMTAVANVIMNRVRAGSWWGSTPAGVSRKRWQFSAWNPNDPNRARMLAVTADDPAFARALEIAERAIDGSLPDITGGATHYHAPSVQPDWADGATVEARIGAHTFYSGVA